jgi:hypothetical protein
MDFGELVTYGALLWLNGWILILATLVQGGPFILAALGIGYTLWERRPRRRSRKAERPARRPGRRAAPEDGPTFTLR